MQWAGCELLAAAFEFQTPPFAMTDPVRVALRIRPFAQRELLEGCEQALSALDGSTVLVGSDRPFTFDHVFGGSASQSTLYETAIQPLIAQCLSGYNATVLAYGQTGSGKTHSMMGAGQCGRSGVFSLIASSFPILI